jgi:cephalosporin hydroxylase
MTSKTLMIWTLACFAVPFGCGDRPSSPATATKSPAAIGARSADERNRMIDSEGAVGAKHAKTPRAARRDGKMVDASPIFKNTFLGIKTLQNPSDAWIIMEIMHEVRPDLIVETGTFMGGSAALWAIILEHINPRGQIVTIDIEDQRIPFSKGLPIVRERVEFLLGSSTAPDIVAEVHRRAEGKRVLVLLDSHHSKEHVAAELEAYAPLIPLGGYLIVQDTMVGPILAISDFLAANDSFVADRSRERYADTNTTGGYLKRVKPRGPGPH